LHNIKTNIGKLVSQNHSDFSSLKSSISSLNYDLKSNSSKLDDLHSDNNKTLSALSKIIDSKPGNNSSGIGVMSFINTTYNNFYSSYESAY